MARTKYIAGFHPDTLKAPQVPTFVSIVQPGYSWREFAHESDYVGRTGLPKGRKKEDAVLIAPNPTSPETAAVRIHELLHAKWTPEVDKMANKLIKAGLSTHAIQIAEDHRIHWLGDKIQAFDIVEASIDRKTTEKYFNARLFDVEASRRTGVPTYRPITTGLLVHASLALSSYPFRDGFNARSMAALVGACPAECESAHDVEKVEALIAEFHVRRDELFAREWKGKKGQINLFGEVAQLVEEILLRAFDEELPKDPGKPEDAGDVEGEGDASDASAGEVGADDSTQKAEGQDKKPQEKLPPRKSRLFEAKIESNPVKVGASEVEKDRQREEAHKAREQRNALRNAGVNPDETKDGVRHIHMRSPEGQTDTGPSAVTRFDEIASVKLSLAPESAGRGWGKMQINRPPLARPRRHLAPRMGRASLDGTMPRHYSRWFSDRSIMDAKGRRPGGTLLIDVSGSMGWAGETTRLLLDVCPAMTLAVYSSTSLTAASGHLSILAKDGKLLPKGYNWRRELSHGGGNVIDGPALAWLIKQPGPRIWYSDGMVTGSGECVELDIYIDAMRLALLGNVTRTVSVEKAMGILAGKERPDPLGGNILSELLNAKARGIRNLTHDLQGKMAQRDDADRDRDRVARFNGTTYAKVLGLAA